ncbi:MULTISPECIES: ABC transporter ATP-binding protein [unclassified Gemella]|uniref:ABC transporter ATP-binding protein n=1 Tax=unclassified Gemella TaxID=2624949 RepID=UPI001C0435D3|nr:MULTISPECIES: ATP-binding cassette domain-containing protein [unclassified Gemella]MBU0278780.1 ATP-binding cassette domain-containing protein [Gemella sp. zg-1178]QWQ38718.1 ATP-binding cassette domain-containing protein [Gemella sp. zg-570]
MILEFRNVHKSFGDTQVLKGVNFTAKSGIANGYLGRNGSGKTTSFRLLLDIFRADKGEILLDGKPIDRKKLKIGYLPEERGMYDGVGLVEQLVYFAMLKGMDKKTAKKEAKRWLDFFELEDNKKQLKTLSKGNAQKIQIIQCVIDDPDILVLDEPFSGLDPVNVGKLKEIINDFLARDKLVIFSSHQMPVVENFCEDINILEKGEVILSGNLENIKKDLGNGKMLLSVRELTREQLLEAICSTAIDVECSLEKDMVLLDFKSAEAKKELLIYIGDLGFNIEEFSLFKPSLEQIFVERVGGSDE